MILRNFISLRAFTVYMENSLRFEISLRSNWPKWNLHRSEFHSAWILVNNDNEVTSHQSEILSWSEISNRFEFTLGTFTLDLKWTQTGLRFHFRIKFHFDVIISVHMTSGRVKVTSVQISLHSNWPKWNFKPQWVFHVNSKCPQRRIIAQNH